jgi:hypothetical protein
MKNDILKKNGQFRNVRVEYGFGAVCPEPPSMDHHCNFPCHHHRSRDLAPGDHQRVIKIIIIIIINSNIRKMTRKFLSEEGKSPTRDQSEINFICATCTLERSGLSARVGMTLSSSYTNNKQTQTSSLSRFGTTITKHF